jgi:hypothetical protein
MDKLINDFTNKYPKATEIANVIKEIQDIPSDISLWISISAGVLMAKLNSGCYSKYYKTPNFKINDEGIDMIAKTYLQNIHSVLIELSSNGFDYTHIKKLERFKPDNFMERLINQCCE